MDLVYRESQSLALKAAEEVMKVLEAAEIFWVIRGNHHANASLPATHDIRKLNLNLIKSKSW